MTKTLSLINQLQKLNCHCTQHEEGPIHQRSKQVEGFIGEEAGMEIPD